MQNLKKSTKNFNRDKSPIRSKKFFKKPTFSSTKRIPKLNDCQILSIEDSTVFNSAANSNKSFISQNDNYFVPQQFRNKKKSKKNHWLSSNTRENRFLNSSKTSIDEEASKNVSQRSKNKKNGTAYKNNSLGINIFGFNLQI